MDTDKMLERQAGESDLQYHKRLLTAKLVDKTLDLDYSTLAPYLYGRTYAPDVARRMAYGSLRTLNLVEEDAIQNAAKDDPEAEQILSDIDMKMIELQKERQRYNDQRREFNKVVAAEGRKEHLYESLVHAANNLEMSVGQLFGYEERLEDLSDNEAVLVFSDWHYGLVVNNVFNLYNKEICRERVKETVMRAAERIALHECSVLHIVCLGDAVHGCIHIGTRVASEELVCDQLMQVSEILAQAICKLSTVVKETHVYMTYGNHGRTIQKKEDSVHRDNMERLIPWWISERLSGYDNIHIEKESDSEFIIFNAAGHDFVASHGDLDSVKASPKLLTTLFNKQFGRNIEYILLGDKHHRESFEELGITAMICGSLCGADDYANEKRLYSTPSQLLLIVNPKRGVDAEYRISFY